MKRVLLLLVIQIAILFQLTGQEEARLMRFPAIHGDKLVFSYGGDLYTASTQGGIARKITADKGYEMFAKFSPDGKKIAFTGQYDGNTEVFLMDAQGGVPQRITYTATLSRDDISDRMGPNNIVMAWTPDGKSIIFRSRKNSFNDFVGQLYSVTEEGEIPTQIPLSGGGFCSFSPDGNKLAFNRVFREFRTWKYYRGGMADDIRIYDYKTGAITNITNNESQDIIPMWWKDNIYYLSDRDRIMNLFVYNTKTKETRKVTNYTDYDIKFPSLGDGRIVFEKGGYLYLMNLETEQVSKVKIIIADDKVTGRNTLKEVAKQIRSVDISPDGKRLAVSARGDIFSIPVEEGVTRNLTQSSGHHDRNTAWSPDGKWIAFVSDMTGEYEIYVQKSDGSEPPQQLTKKSKNYIYRIQWSNDSKKILWNDKLMRLQYVDLESKKTTLVCQSRLWEITQFNWSPDNKWIVYTDPQKNNMTRIVLYNLDTENKTFITDEWFSSSSPVFSADGKFIAFVSDRDFNPIYSAKEWNHAYRNMARIFLLPLTKDTKNPFAPENDEVSIDDMEEKEKEEEKEKSDEETMTIDLDGIAERIIALPVRPASYGNIYVNKNRVYYVEHYFGEKGTRFYMYDMDKKKEELLGDNMRFNVSSNGKKMLVASKGNYYVINIPTSKVTLKEAVKTDQLQTMINLEEEWQQIFDESWRQMRDFFYAENMHGVDWDFIYKKYNVLVPHVVNRNDLNYIIGEMIGELNVGHAYVNGGDKPSPERIQTGMLGAELSRDKSGYYRIDKILRGQNWDKKLRSPLTEPGIKASEGNYIIAINGNHVNHTENIYQMLVGKAGHTIELTLSENPDTKGSWKIYIEPLAHEADLYYYAWVQDNINKVNKATNGRVGYLHIPDMGQGGLNEFVKHFYPQITKEALIIDDRGNGGGNVSPMIIERLRREVIRMSAPRNVKEPSTVPKEMIYGPIVLLVNEYSASDGDLFPYAFKKLNMGTVIGTRTWGGVIGIRGSLPFIDGGDLRKPEFGTYSSDTGEWMVEGYGVDPDITIENNPAEEYKGIDRQLEKAIEVVLEQLKEVKELPDKPADPNRSK